MSDADELDTMIKGKNYEEEASRRRDGDFLHGQIVGASFVLDAIGAPTMHGGFLLTTGQRLEAFKALQVAPFQGREDQS